MSIFDKDLSLVDHEWLRIIQRDFLDGNPIKVKIGLEGQTLNDNKDYVLGCRAGPEKHISNLIHEMAHLAEREIPKLIERPYFGWGFTYGRYWEIMGQSGYEPWTDQSVRREMRVWAYQWSFIQHYGILLNEKYREHSLHNLIHSVTFVNSWNFYQNKHPFENLKYHEKEEAQIQLCAEEVDELARTQFTFDAFLSAWNERMLALKNHPVSIAA